jgi:hypothetical protein
MCITGTAYVFLKGKANGEDRTAVLLSNSTFIGVSLDDASESSQALAVNVISHIEYIGEQFKRRCLRYRRVRQRTPAHEEHVNRVKCCDIQ